MESFWFSLLVRSSVILAAAELLRRYPRRAPAAYRHRIVLAGFGMLAAWPMLSAAIPMISLPSWPQKHLNDIVTVEQTVLIFGRHATIWGTVSWPLAIWIAGVLLTLLPVALAYLRVLRLERHATPVSGHVWDDVLGRLCRRLHIKQRPLLLVVSAPIMPMTFGFRRPRIMLPAGCEDWSAVRREAVLLHELAHIARRDLVARIFASLVTAIWWFQPLCWIARMTLRRESERACDAVVLDGGIRPSLYATELLDIARSFLRGQRWTAAAITMARRGELAWRLDTILEPQTLRVRPRLWTAPVSILAVLTLTTSAVAFTNSKGGTNMKRTLLGGLLSSMGLSAATISGSLFDPVGAAVSNAQATLYNPDTSARQQTTTTDDGKFSFTSLPAGEYILRIDKPGFATLFREFNVRQEATVERGMMLAPGTNPPNAHQIRVPGEDQRLRLIYQPKPAYPAAAKLTRTQGVVQMEMVISAEGVPSDIRVISSPSDDLTQSALDATRQWRYRPALLNGEPIEVVTNVTVNYTLAQ